MSSSPEFIFEPRVSLVTLGVSDLERAVRFYQALGWRRWEAAGEGVAFFQMGGMVLALWGREELAKDADVDVAGTGFRAVTLAHNVRERSDVDRALAKAQACGAHITRPASDALWGGRTGYFTDPDGHLWEVAWNPGFPMEPDGAIRLPT